MVHHPAFRDGPPAGVCLVTSAVVSGTERRRSSLRSVHRIFTTSVADVYPHYVAKVERKGRTKAELDRVIEWLTGFDQPRLQELLDADTTFEVFFASASPMMAKSWKSVSALSLIHI